MYRQISGAEGGVLGRTGFISGVQPEGIAAGFSAEKPEGLNNLDEEEKAIREELARDLESLEKQGAVKSFANLGHAASMEYNDLYGYQVMGKKIFANETEILTDIEWGVFYNLQRSVSMEFRKKYLQAVAERRLRALTDRRFIAAGKELPNAQAGTRKAYEARELEPDESRPGLLAEKMVRNVLKKGFMEVFGQEKGYGIEEVSIYYDVELKIDFIIHVPNKKRRGVGVEETRDIGIQFSINTDLKNTQHKTEQVSRVKRKMGDSLPVDELVLIKFPMNKVMTLFEQWKKEGKKPGGPDKLWSGEEKEIMVRNILNNLVDREIIDKICERVNIYS